MRQSVAFVLACSLLPGSVALAQEALPPPAKPTRVVGWVSDGHCGAAHKPGGIKSLKVQKLVGVKQR